MDETVEIFVKKMSNMTDIKFHKKLSIEFLKYIKYCKY